MNTMIRAVLSFSTFAAFSTLSQAGPVSGPWVASAAETIANSNTDHPTLGTGVSNSAVGGLYATITPTSLQVGESVTLNATIQVTGAVTTNPDYSIRFGIFDTNGSAGLGAWKGYLAMTRTTAGADAIVERSGTGTGAFYSSTNGTWLADSDNTRTGTPGNGTYKLTQTIARTQAGLTVTVSVNQTSSGSPAYVFTSVSHDSSPLTTSFNSVAFYFVSAYSPDQIVFSNISLVKSNAGSLIELGFNRPIELKSLVALR